MEVINEIEQSINYVKDCVKFINPINMPDIKSKNERICKLEIGLKDDDEIYVVYLEWPIGYKFANSNEYKSSLHGLLMTKSAYSNAFQKILIEKLQSQ